jgi:hypothetical protein
MKRGNCPVPAFLFARFAAANCLPVVLDLGEKGYRRGFTLMFSGLF